VGKYDKVKVGDQFERPKLHARGLEVVMVTHIWDDPVEQKTYVGMAHIRSDGTVGSPTIKHTRRGIGTNRWKPASRDWIAWAQAVQAENVVPLQNPLPSRWRIHRPLVQASPDHMVQDPDYCEVLFDQEVKGEIWRDGSTWNWMLRSHPGVGVEAAEAAAARALVSAFEAHNRQSHQEGARHE
jgi:hypothetical protein